jgi:hypothetical protein
MGPSVGETDARSCHEILHGSGSQHFAWLGCGLDPDGDIDPEADHIVAVPLDLSAV